MVTAKKTPTATKKATPAATAPAAASKASAAKSSTSGVEAVIDRSRQFVREASHTYVGLGVLAVDAIKSQTESNRKRVDHLLADAKVKGATQVKEFEGQFEAQVKDARKRVDPIFSKVQVPGQITETFEKGAERVKSLINA